MKLILIGFMGSGKSTMASLLAKHYKSTCIEMDEKIVAKSGAASVVEIFAKSGEKEFRRLESEVATELKDITSAVISSGGGIVSSARNIELLKQNGGIVCYLKTSFDEVKVRLSGDTTRPLMNDDKGASSLFKSREALYEQYSDFSIVTNRRTPSDLLKEIVQKVAQLSTQCPS